MNHALELREKSVFLPCTSVVFEKPVCNGQGVCCLSPTSIKEVVSRHLCHVSGQTSAQEAGKDEGGLSAEDEGGVLVLAWRDWAL